MDYRFTEAQQQLRAHVRKLADEQLAPRQAEFEDSDTHPAELYDILRLADLFPYTIPEQYGGYGVKSVNICIIREELARGCVAADETVAMQGLASYPIVRFGNEAQKQKYLPSLATGEKLSSFCLTEPVAGSDVAGIASTAQLDGDHFVLNGTKIYVARYHDANIFTVFAKTAPELKGRGISAFIVERSPQMRFESMRLQPMNGEGRMFMEGVRVPKENLLGEPERGMRVALGNLNVFRPTVGAATIGMAQNAYEEAVRFARERLVSGQPIIELHAIQGMLVDMAVLLEASRLFVYRAAFLEDAGLGTIKDASMAKFYATESCQKVVDSAVQVFGGRGVWQSNRVSFLYRAVRAPRVYEGSTQIQRLVIAREIVKADSAEASLSVL